MRVPVLHWFTSGALAADWALRIDTLTVVMLVVVNTVSALVHIYSIGYMAHDPHRPRFFAYLSLFTFAMLMLVTADNLVQMFFGWEGVGLASYLLIGFWYKRPSANAAAIKAFVVNRVGDFGFALGIFGVFCALRLGRLRHDLRQRRRRSPRQRRSCSTSSAMRCDGARRDDRRLPAPLHGRDGQVGAGPAPHLAARRHGRPDAGLGAHPRRDHGDGRRLHGGAAVAALRAVARPRSPSSPSSARSPPSSRRPSAWCRTTSSASSPIRPARSSATCSWRSASAPIRSAIFHLFTHAFFKALLFLGSGSVIHAVSDEQDMRKMGGLRKLHPAHLLDDGRSARWR